MWAGRRLNWSRQALRESLRADFEHRAACGARRTVNALPCRLGRKRHNEQRERLQPAPQLAVFWLYELHDNCFIDTKGKRFLPVAGIRK